VWAVYRGRLERHDNGGPEGRNATVMVATEEEIKALQVHGCFGSLVDVNWKDVARTKVEDWRPGEEEEEEEDDEEKFTATKTQEEAESWSDVKGREDEEDITFENGLHRELHLELCEAFFSRLWPWLSHCQVYRRQRNRIARNVANVLCY